MNSSGIHSVTQKLYTDTMATSDVGSPIADLVKTSITSNPTLEPKALFYPGENQYILALVLRDKIKLNNATNDKIIECKSTKGVPEIG